VWILGGPLDPALNDIQFWNQSLAFETPDELDEIELDGSASELHDRFGTALAAGDFNGDSREDLAIGVPFEDLRIQTGATTFGLIIDAGAVVVIYGSAIGLAVDPARGAIRRAQFWTQRFLNGADAAEPDDRFGSKLTAWNFGRNEVSLCLGCGVGRTTDLAIGVPLEDVGTVRDAGAVNVIYGLRSANGLITRQNPPFSTQFWTQASPGVQGDPETDDKFGSAVY
jgi:FG-GAP repeat protein